MAGAAGKDSKSSGGGVRPSDLSARLPTDENGGAGSVEVAPLEEVMLVYRAASR